MRLSSLLFAPLALPFLLAFLVSSERSTLVRQNTLAVHTLTQSEHHRTEGEAIMTSAEQ